VLSRGGRLNVGGGLSPADWKTPPERPGLTAFMPGPARVWLPPGPANRACDAFVANRSVKPHALKRAQPGLSPTPAGPGKGTNPRMRSRPIVCASGRSRVDRGGAVGEIESDGCHRGRAWNVVGLWGWSTRGREEVGQASWFFPSFLTRVFTFSGLVPFLFPLPFYRSFNLSLFSFSSA